MSQKRFTDCEAVRQARDQYEKESDSVKLFLEESDYTSCVDSYVTLENIYREYQRFCLDDGYHSVSKLKFRKRIEAAKIQTDKKNVGKVVFVRKAQDSYNQNKWGA